MMADLQINTPMVSISFSITDGKNTLRDAIVIRKDQYESMSQSEIEAEAQRRFDEWVEIINNPPENTVINADTNEELTNG